VKSFKVGQLGNYELLREVLDALCEKADLPHDFRCKKIDEALWITVKSLYDNRFKRGNTVKLKKILEQHRSEFS